MKFQRSGQVILPTIRPLVQLFCPSLPTVSEDIQTSIRENTAQGILLCLDLMPRYMRAGIIILTIGFDWSGILWTAKRFRDQDAPRREKQVHFWQRCPLPIARDLMQFYQKMGTFLYYSEVERKNDQS
ncbi:MAG: hypothetical protein WC552_01160 [Candidatus Omnitrophota bacterium]